MLNKLYRMRIRAINYVLNKIHEINFSLLETLETEKFCMNSSKMLLYEKASYVYFSWQGFCA